MALFALALATAACGHGPAHRIADAAVATPPPLGPPTARLGPARWLSPESLALARPFQSVIVLQSAALGLAAGGLYRLPAGASSGGVRVDPFAGAPAHVLAVAGVDTAYVLFNTSHPFVARSDDGGATWHRGGDVAPSALPEVPVETRLSNPETVPALAAWGNTVAFALGEIVLVSRDGGATFAPRPFGGVVHSLAVTHAGTVVATARLAAPPANDPIGLVRDDGRAAPARTVVFAHDDACAIGRVYSLATGAVLLGSDRGLLGLCDRVSRDDARHFVDAAPGATADAAILATPSGVVVRRRAGAGGGRFEAVASTPDAAVLAALPVGARRVGFDVGVDGETVVGSSDALVRARGAAAVGSMGAVVRADPNGVLAFAAARDALAWMNGDGVITVVTPDAAGAPRVRSMQSPCRFPRELSTPRDRTLLALDGRGAVCCASISGADDEGGAACGALGDDAPTWRAIDPAPASVESGDGAIALLGARTLCVVAGDPATAHAPDTLALTPASHVRDLSCADHGVAAAAVFDGAGAVNILSPYTLRLASGTARALTTAQRVGVRDHLFARGNGLVVAAVEGEGGPAVQVYRAGQLRSLREGTLAGAYDPPSFVAPWDETTSLVSGRTGLMVVSPDQSTSRAFVDGTRFELVARIGNALVGVTSTGRFAVLAPR